MHRMADEQSKRLRGGAGKEGDAAGCSGRGRTGDDGHTEDEFRAGEEALQPGEDEEEEEEEEDEDEDEEDEEEAGSSEDEEDEEEDDEEEEEDERVVVKEGKRGGGAKPPFGQGEKVLAYHGDLLYYAKVLEVETDALGRSSFLIHYMGWKKSWDEWVGTERLLKDSPANQRKKAELEKGQQHGGHHSASTDKHKKTAVKAKEPKSVPAARSAKGRAPVAVAAPQAVAGPGRGRKRGREVGEQVLSATEVKRGHASPQDAPAAARGHTSAQDASATAREEGGERAGSAASPGQAPDVKGAVVQGEGLEQGSRRHAGGRGLSKEAVGPEMSISIPLPLKKQLVADEKMIVHKGELLELPARPTVQEILDLFLEQRGKELTAVRSGGAEAPVAETIQETEDVITALRDYFDRTLALMLLYRQERQQYMDHFPAAAAAAAAAQSGAAAGPGAREDTSAKAPWAAGRQAGTSTPSLVYGGEHLLRLFTKLPSMMSYLDMEEDTRSELQAHLSMLLKFMLKNQTWIFPGSPRYIRVAEQTPHNGAALS